MSFVKLVVEASLTLVRRFSLTGLRFCLFICESKYLQLKLKDHKCVYMSPFGTKQYNKVD